MPNPPKPFFNLDDFVPGLREALAQAPLDLHKMLVAGVPVKPFAEGETPEPAGTDRRRLEIVAGDDVCEWQVDSLRALFRGDKQPPVLGAYPKAYDESFLIMDLHALEISRIFGDRRDMEMLEIYSVLRRRPDGKSLGFVHDFMWQAAAIMLGVRPHSQAEFEAIMNRLERSCRTFAQGPSSRNYIAALRSTIGQADN